MEPPSFVSILSTSHHFLLVSGTLHLSDFKSHHFHFSLPRAFLHHSHFSLLRGFLHHSHFSLLEVPYITLISPYSRVFLTSLSLLPTQGFLTSLLFPSVQGSPALHKRKLISGTSPSSTTQPTRTPHSSLPIPTRSLIDSPA